MDQHPTPFPVKKKPSKQKTNRQTTDSSKNTIKEPPISRSNRVFGTVRTTNVPAKTITEKPPFKVPIGISQLQSKPSQLTPKPTKVAKKSTTETLKQSSPEKPKPRLKKKSVCFQKQNSQNPDNALQEESVIGPKTPVSSPSLNKAKIAGTPYLTAQNCSKCRFDRLETASYWLGQIKYAETVGKHSVSAAFFRLAFDSKAEPTRNLRIELKRYLVRHGYLSTQTEWRECSLTYGLLKDANYAVCENLDTGEAVMRGNSCAGIEQDSNKLKHQTLLQLDNVSN
ncbi:hypothetical protein CFOL_v3_21567 [Cephalotus follicularis]|uniref:Uncharacterized protein n=1 Tax=Cephalotus follicularis TaxID=3775 RepID=A0A1Q3CCY4_CEPFO|nr:hypothetical protein CFOL_v3_21567 [Cephalotus follicularis]